MKKIAWILGMAIVVILLFFLTCSLAQGAMLEVPTQHSTIQLAIENALDGDTVMVRPGIYLESINFLGKAIIVSSIAPEDPKVVRATVVLAHESRAAVYFENQENESSILKGMTISHQEGVLGCGVDCYGASPVIQNNLIVGNQIGIKCMADIVEMTGGSPLIQNNIISANKKGAISCAWFASPMIINNTLVDNSNSSSEGAGLTISGLGASAVVSNCIFWNQTSPEIAGSAKVSYSCVKDGYHGDKNFSWNPCLAEDYRLKSMAGRWDPMFNSGAGAWVIDQVQSPCIDAGDPEADCSSELPPNGDRLNLGAYGNTSLASKTSRVPTQIKAVILGHNVLFNETWLEIQWWARKDETYKVYISSDLLNWSFWSDQAPIKVKQDQPYSVADFDGPNLPRRFYRLNIEPRQ